MKRFRKVYIEITNICNMHCSFCPETKRAKATMSTQAFEHIAKEILPYTDYVYLHVKGEPLLHPNLKEILDICRKYNLKVNLSTNGTLLSKKEECLKNIRQLNVSLHSFEDSIKEDLQNYLDSVIQCCNTLVKSGVIIRYKLWNDKSGENNSKIIQKLEQMYNIAINSTEYAKDIKLDKNIFLSIKSPFRWPNIKDENNAEGTCYGLRHQIAILVDGTVVPCCVDNNGDIALGNIFETSLDKILNSSKSQNIKRDFENNKCSEVLCRKCQYRNYVI